MGPCSYGSSFKVLPFDSYRPQETLGGSNSQGLKLVQWEHGLTLSSDRRKTIKDVYNNNEWSYSFKVRTVMKDPQCRYAQLENPYMVRNLVTSLMICFDKQQSNQWLKQAKIDGLMCTIQYEVNSTRYYQKIAFFGFRLSHICKTHQKKERNDTS